MRVKKKTITLAKIRRYMRQAIDWYMVDDGMPTHWSTKNYQRAKRMKGLVLKKSDMIDLPKPLFLCMKNFIDEFGGFK